MIRHWSNTVTISCIVIAAGVLALQTALSGAPDVRALLPAFAVSPKINYVPVLLLTVAGVVWLVGRWQSRTAPRPKPSGTSTTNPQYLNVDEFYRTYDNTFLREVEGLVLQQSNQYQPGSDRERFLIRYSATVLGTAIFEYVWWQMGSSQFRAVQALNSKLLTLDDLHRFYDEGKASRPKFYQTYSFEQWLAFLRTTTFVVESGNTLQISVRGREFLKYVTHCGYDPTAKEG